MHRVVIVGGGFGGLYAAKALRRTPVDVTLVDRRNFHLFQPLLYQVATGSLSPGEIGAPLFVMAAKCLNCDEFLAAGASIETNLRQNFDKAIDCHLELRSTALHSLEVFHS